MAIKEGNLSRKGEFRPLICYVMQRNQGFLGNHAEIFFERKRLIPTIPDRRRALYLRPTLGP